jgi:beta-mannosidase
MMKYLYLLILLAVTELYAQQSRTLHENWEFRSLGLSDSTYEKGPEIKEIYNWNAAKVPGVIHSDLLRNKLIKNPWYGTNEKAVQWIENHNWQYRCNFNLSEEEFDKKHIELLFEGLDTYADVYLNDSLILQADNMFRCWKKDIKKILLNGENRLLIVFKDPKTVNRSKLKALAYELPAGSENVPLKVSPFTRKAAYHFGWDWGPRLLTCGIWRPIKLEFWDELRIEDINIVQKSLSDSLAVLSVETFVNVDLSADYKLIINGKKHELKLNAADKKIAYEIEIKKPKLWWPNGWGKAHLYPIKVEIVKGNKVLATATKKIGLRSIELVQEVDEIGKSYYFKVNGIPIFIKGANYIPQSHFLPEVSENQYKSLIADAKKVNINMLRVWGGGIYENDIFYELCDEAGILVWQDFMFAGSMYPGDTAFVENVQEEVRENVIRLRNHACIAQWNGNNEMNVAWFNWGWQKAFGWSEADSAKIRQDYEKMFHVMIPEQIKELDSSRFYTPTSPLSNWGKAENFNFGSMHYWGVWHGKDNFEDYSKNVGRFMAEYGFQSFPEMKTILKFADSSSLSLDSEIMKWHQKSYVGNSMIQKQVDKYFGKSLNFEDFVNKSQEAQALAMQMAIDAHRLRKGHCWGTLYWQYNDCWPGPSWSSRDVYGNWKKLHHRLETLYAPLALIPEIEGNMMHIYLLNDLPHAATAKILIKNKQQKILRKKIICAANSKSTACKIDLSKLKINDLNLSIYLKGKKVFERIGY